MIDRARWAERAACRGVDPEVFHAKTASGQQHAITTWCLCCPVRAECLADALDLGADQDYGVRGGTTAPQRRALRKRPGLPAGRGAEAVTVLRQLLDDEQPNYRPTPLPAPRPRRRAPKETIVHKPHAAAVAAASRAADLELEQPVNVEPETAAPVRSVSDFLDWAEQHPEAAVRKHAATAREVLAAITRRHAAETELARVTSEAEELRQRLAELDARAKTLKTPAKAKAQRDYDPAEVRAWARLRGLPCPAFGQVPKAVLEAWRERDAA